jgi:gamma-glutamyl-gamma-aminobutyrate hydrolase PuuD
MRPLIGIPPCLDEVGRWRSGREYQYVDAAYARAVEAAGGTPVYLPLQEDAAALVDRLDGLLIPGGDDLLPERPYPPEVVFDPTPERQLAFDRALLAAALERRVPVLAICYGMQLLALARGGTLHYDVATDVPEAGPHRLSGRDGRHGLRITPGSRLASILGQDPGPVNSRHHQAVAEPGAGARVCAVAEDGLVEAIELEGEPFAIGVQWHPETLDGAHRERLFGAFSLACREGS